MQMNLHSMRPDIPRLAVARWFPLRAAAVVGLALLAYNYSLMTLARGLTLQTPLAYLALVPVMSLGLAIARLRLEPPSLPIHDRQVDWIIGLGLLAVTAGVLILLPDPTSSTFWLQRVDLLTLPIFVSGLIALLFGVRRLWSLRGPVAFLFLAWPIPFNFLLSATSDQFTEFTARTVGAFTRLVPIARAGTTDDTLFYMGSGAHTFGVAIASACAGMNSLVGFLLLGTAMLYLVRGPIVRRIAWMTAGLALVFALNAVRIIAILAVGDALGQEAALNILHPVAGLIVFNIGVIGMVALVPPFGLRFISGSDVKALSAPRLPSPVRRARAALVVAVAVAIALAVTNSAYARFEAISSGLADARLHSFDVRTAQVPHWQTRFAQRFLQATQYFGSTATWQRVMYLPTSDSTLQSNRAVYVDVITTDDPGTFVSFGLDACYAFHGYRIASVSTTEIGAGVKAQVIDYTTPKEDVDWSALWWEWPYQESGRTRYERIVVFVANGPDAAYSGYRKVSIGTQSPRFVQTDEFLTTLGQSIVRSQLLTASPS